MAENTRSSRLAVVEETTEGTLVDPSLATQFIPLRPGFSFTPNVEEKINDELRGSIGQSSSIPGLEQPAASFNEYLKHSGVEGQAPNYGIVIESCLGSVSTNSTERLTAAASTTTLLKLASGGADFDNPTTALGKAVLVKNGSGHEIRAVDSRSGNDLTLGFALNNAPAAGLGVGKCVNYKPEDSGHPTFSSFLYRANGGALESMAGCRTTAMTMNLSVGELIGLDFTVAGTAFFVNPIRVVSGTNDKLDFTDDDGTWAATIPAGVYKHPIQLAAAIQAAMRAASTEDATVVYYSTGANKGKFQITSTGTVLSLLWNTGANTADSIGASIGYSLASDDTGVAAGTGYLSDSVLSYASALTPSYDAADPMTAKSMEVLIGNQTDYESACVQSMTLSINNVVQDVKCISAESGVEGKVVQNRTSEISIVAQLKRHDADKFYRFIENVDTKFQFSFGAKSGGNWVAGKSGCFYAKSCKISAYEHGDDNGLVTMQYTLKPYVDANGNPEIFLNFL